MFGASKRASFLKLEVIMNQIMWEQNVKQKNMNGRALFRAVLYVCPNKFSFMKKKCLWKNSFTECMREASDNVFIEKVEVCSRYSKFSSVWMMVGWESAFLSINNKNSSSRYLSLCALERVCLDSILAIIPIEEAEDFLDC